MENEITQKQKDLKICKDFIEMARDHPCPDKLEDFIAWERKKESEVKK